MSPERFAARAEALAGARFRLGGRDPDHGLDCVGVVACALGPDARAPAGYALRNASIARHLHCLAEAGFAPAGCGDHRRGDLILVQPGPAQHHLLVALGGAAFVHAHASLRRVVIHRGQLPWPEFARWRLATLKD